MAGINMMTTDSVVEVGQISYTDFPTYNEILKQRTDVIQQIIKFFRMIGLGTPMQINNVIGSKEDDNKITILMKRIGIKESIDEEMSAETKRETEEMQKKILKNDSRNCTIKVSDICRKFQKIPPPGIEQIIEELIDKQDNGFAVKTLESETNSEITPNQPQKESTTTAQEKEAPKDEPEDKTVVPTENETINTIPQEILDTIHKTAAECPIRPRHDFETVRHDAEYILALTEYFPLVSYAVISNYLFSGSASTSVVSATFRGVGIKKSRVGRQTPKIVKLTAIAEASFICWAGKDYSEHLTKGLSKAETMKKERDASFENSTRRRIKKRTIQTPLAPRINEPPHEDVKPTNEPIEQSPPIIVPEPSPLVQTDESIKGNNKSMHVATIVISSNVGRSPIDGLIKYIITDGSTALLNLDAFSIIEK